VISFSSVYDCPLLFSFCFGDDEGHGLLLGFFLFSICRGEFEETVMLMLVFLGFFVCVFFVFFLCIFFLSVLLGFFPLSCSVFFLWFLLALFFLLFSVPFFFRSQSLSIQPLAFFSFFLRVCLYPAFIRPEIDRCCNGRLLNAL